MTEDAEEVEGRDHLQLQSEVEVEVTIGAAVVVVVILGKSMDVMEDLTAMAMFVPRDH